MLEAAMPDSRWPSTLVGGSAWFDPVLDRFDQAWQVGVAPRLEDYLPGEGDPRRLRALEGLVHTDLEYRLKAGEPARVEDYLSRFPEIARDQRLLLDLLAWEFELRRR